MAGGEGLASDARARGEEVAAGEAYPLDDPMPVDSAVGLDNRLERFFANSNLRLGERAVADARTLRKVLQ